MEKKVKVSTVDSLIALCIIITTLILVWSYVGENIETSEEWSIGEELGYIMIVIISGIGGIGMGTIIAKHFVEMRSSHNMNCKKVTERE